MASPAILISSWVVGRPSEILNDSAAAVPLIPIASNTCDGIGTADWQALPADTCTDGIDVMTASASAPSNRRFKVFDSELLRRH